MKPTNCNASDKGKNPHPVKPLTVTLADFCTLISVKRSSAYKLIAENRVESVKVLGRTLITMRSVEALIFGAQDGGGL